VGAKCAADDIAIVQPTVTMKALHRHKPKPAAAPRRKAYRIVR
jgi:hypothetical protein